MSSGTSSISPEALGEAMEVGAAAGTFSTSPDSPSSSSPTATHPNFRIAPVGTATKQHAEAALQLQRSLRPHTERNQPGKRPCDRCRRSKVKCDREQPCNQCVKRKEACTYDVPVMRPGRIAVHEMAAFAYKDIPWVTFRGRLKTSSAESTRRRRTSSAGTAKSLEHVHFDDSSDAGDSSASSSWSTASTTVLEQRAAFEFDPSPSSAPTHAAAAAAFASGSSAPPTPQVLDHPTNATSWSASTLCDSPGAANAAKGKSPESSKNHGMPAPISLPTPNGQTTSASTSASPTRPAPFSDLYERGSDDELTPMWTVKQDIVARQTLDIASSEATAVPHVYRRYPVKGFGLLALQQHLMGSLEDPTPFIPCYHTPYRYKVRAMAVGNSIQRASLRRPHVILLDSQGLLQAVSTSECSLDLRYLFNQQWHTLDHRGQAISPPWHLLNEQNDRIDTIWPANVNNGLADVQGTEADYDDAREQAQKLLANAATSHLIEIEYNCKSHFSILSGHTINEYLTQIVDHSGSQQWSPTQDRHRRALLLSIAVASAQYTGQLPLRVGNVETSLSLWEFAFSAMKLAWRLLRPRQGQHFAREELSVEALVALTHLVDAMRSHPQHAFLSLAVKRLVTNPAIHQALVLDTSGNPDAQQSLVRLYAFHVRETVAFRLWHNIDTPLRFRHLFEMLVPLQPRPGELIDERQGGGLMRQKAREEIFAARLDLMNEEILDSALLQTLPSPEQTAERRSVMLSREIQSESFFLRLLEWKQAALHIDYPSSVPLTFERPSQPSLLDPHLDWRNCSEVLLNLFVSSLEIIAASLREINSSHFSQAVQKEIDTTPTFAQIKATRMGDWLMSSATYFRTRRYAEGAIRGRRSKP